jgi:DNA helicase IV
VRGERVKSLGEVHIANFLYMHQIAYQYEPFLLYGLHPDFYLTQYNIYIEYCGETGLPESKYWKEIGWKVDQYRFHKIRFIPIFPEDLSRLDSVFGMKIRETVRRKF